MAREHQEGTWTQLRLFEEQGGSVRHGAESDGGTEPEAREEGQAATASTRERALTDNLMERVSERENLNRAYKRVKGNKGAPGIDGMTVGELAGWIKEHKEGLVNSLLDGSYRPQAVKGVEIPKPSEGDAPAGDTDRGGPAGTASDATSARSTTGSNVLRVELRVSAGAERASSAEARGGVCSGGTKDRGGL